MSAPFPEPDPAQVIRELFAAVILHGHVAAHAVGMHVTDLFALTIVELYGPLGAGELAARTGLSTGATTRLIDRLERIGQIRRVPDPTDRRRVSVEKVYGHALDPALSAAFQPIGANLERLLDAYPADRLAEIVDFLAKATVAVQEATRTAQRARTPV